MISQTVEYALRAIVAIARNGGRPLTAMQISEAAQVPTAYLSKLMQGLVRGGLVNSQRGLHGGFVLTSDPRELTIWDVLTVVEPLERIEQCPVGNSSHATTLCPLHCQLDRAIECIEMIFREATIADMLPDSGEVPPLCELQKTILLRSNTARPPRHDARRPSRTR